MRRIQSKKYYGRKGSLFLLVIALLAIMVALAASFAKAVASQRMSGVDQNAATLARIGGEAGRNWAMSVLLKDAATGAVTHMRRGLGSISFAYLPEKDNGSHHTSFLIRNELVGSDGQDISYDSVNKDNRLWIDTRYGGMGSYTSGRYDTGTSLSEMNTQWKDGSVGLGLWWTVSHYDSLFRPCSSAEAAYTVRVAIDVRDLDSCLNMNLHDDFVTRNEGGFYQVGPYDKSHSVVELLTELGMDASTELKLEKQRFLGGTDGDESIDNKEQKNAGVDPTDYFYHDARYHIDNYASRPGIGDTYDFDTGTTITGGVAFGSLLYPPSPANNRPLREQHMATLINIFSALGAEDAYKIKLTLKSQVSWVGGPPSSWEEATAKVAKVDFVLGNKDPSDPSFDPLGWQTEEAQGAVGECGVAARIFSGYGYNGNRVGIDTKNLDSDAVIVYDKDELEKGKNPLTGKTVSGTDLKLDPLLGVGPFFSPEQRAAKFSRIGLNRSVAAWYAMTEHGRDLRRTRDDTDSNGFMDTVGTGSEVTAVDHPWYINAMTANSRVVQLMTVPLSTRIYTEMGGSGDTMHHAYDLLPIPPAKDGHSWDFKEGDGLPPCIETTESGFLDYKLARGTLSQDDGRNHYTHMMMGRGIKEFKDRSDVVNDEIQSYHSDLAAATCLAIWWARAEESDNQGTITSILDIEERFLEILGEDSNASFGSITTGSGILREIYTGTVGGFDTGYAHPLDTSKVYDFIDINNGPNPQRGRSRCMEHLLNDWRMTLFGTVAKDFNGDSIFDCTTTAPDNNGDNIYDGLDVDKNGDGKVNALDDPERDDFIGYITPTNHQAVFSLTGRLFVGVSRYWDIFTRTEVWDRRSNTLLTTMGGETIFCRDENGDGDLSDAYIINHRGWENLQRPGMFGSQAPEAEGRTALGIDVTEWPDEITTAAP